MERYITYKGHLLKPVEFEDTELDNIYWSQNNSLKVDNFYIWNPFNTNDYILVKIILNEDSGIKQLLGFNNNRFSLWDIDPFEDLFFEISNEILAPDELEQFRGTVAIHMGGSRKRKLNKKKTNKKKTKKRKTKKRKTKRSN
jgi:hypothetical protein